MGTEMGCNEFDFAVVALLWWEAVGSRTGVTSQR